MRVTFDQIHVGDRVTFRRLHQKGKLGDGLVTKLEPPGPDNLLGHKSGTVHITGTYTTHDVACRWDASIPVTLVVSVISAGQND